MSATGDMIDRVERENSDLRRRIAQLEADLERAFNMLAVYGVPKERARSVANGIDVLATRYGKELRFNDMELRDLRNKVDFYLDKLQSIANYRQIGGETPERQVEFCVSVAESATNAFPPKEGE